MDSSIAVADRQRSMTTTFSITRHVQFSETDMAGVVHFSNYFRWMEETEHAFFRSIGVSIAMSHTSDALGWPRVSTTCLYMRPVRFEDEVLCQLVVQRVGAGSLTHEVTFLVRGEPVARGSMTVACCTLVHGELRSQPIPAAVRARFPVLD